MNSDQFKQTFAPLVAAIGGYLVGSGKLTSDQLSTYSNLLWQYGPGVLAAAGMAYAWWKNRPSEQVKSISNLPPAVANAAVASLPPESVTAIKVATMPDKAIIAAAAAVPGVAEIRVADNATDGAKAAAQDTSLPTVKPVSAP